MLLSQLTQLLLRYAVISQQKDIISNQPTPKRIAIVGSGSAGLGALKAIVDVTERGWHIDLFERRSDLGGIWLEDEGRTKAPRLPETPIYPALVTNTPHPTMTYPGFPFPPLTPLYPGHHDVMLYHRAFATRNNLTRHIHLDHAVLNASYGDSRWTLHIQEKDNAPRSKLYDHLVVASGHSQYPNVPLWKGRREWLRGGQGREITHSIYYRRPVKYSGRDVVIGGFGASGADIAKQVIPFANKVYHSYTGQSHAMFPSQPVPGTIHIPRISHLTSDFIVLTNGTALETDRETSILLATGYDLLIPWLHPLIVRDKPAFPNATTPCVDRPGTLTTNTRLLHPLHNHVFAITESLPLNALSFVGLPAWIANAPSDYAQGLYVAHAIKDGSWLPSKEDALGELELYQSQLMKAGWNLETVGHRFPLEGQAEYYQNDLITNLRKLSSTPLPPYLQSNLSRDYVEPWPVRGRQNATLLRAGWERATREGVGKSLLEGAESEDEWAAAMGKVAEWEQRREREDSGRTIFTWQN